MKTLDYLNDASDFTGPAFAAGFNELTFWAARFGLLLFDHLPLEPNLRILDLGCAAGFPLFELANVYGETCRVIGLDVWLAALRQARVHEAVYQFSNVDLVHGDGHDLPLAGACMDLVVSNLGVNNFTDPHKVLGECARILRSGGKLALTTNLAGHMREFYAVYRETLRELGMAAAVDRLDVQEAHRGTRASLTAMVASAGLKVTRIAAEEFQMRYLDGSALLRHSLTRVGFLGGWRSVLDAGVEAEVFAALEDRLNQKAKASGALNLTIPMLYLEAAKP